MSFKDSFRRSGMRFTERMARFLYGRNGPDVLYWVSFILSLVFAILHTFLRFWPFFVLYLLFFGYALFRFFSRKRLQRQKENNAFLNFFRRIFDRKHAYRTCPSCKCNLRLPRRKGKHTARCPRCGNSFPVKI